jgi:hypothetical protein
MIMNPYFLGVFSNPPKYDRDADSASGALGVNSHFREKQ